MAEKEEKTIKHKSVTLTVCDVLNSESKITSSNFLNNLVNTLDNTETSKKRLMVLNSSEKGNDSDFIASYKVTKSGFLFGAFIRLNPDFKTTISNKTLEKNQIMMEELTSSSNEDIAGTVKDSAYFGVLNNKIVMSSCHNNLRALEVYINWLLTEIGEITEKYRIQKQVKSKKEISIDNVKSVRLGDNYLDSFFINQAESNNVSKSFNLKKEIINLFLNETETKEDIDIENIISAYITLKLNKRALKKDGAMGQLLRILDSDDVKMNTRDGKKLTGRDFTVQEIFDIELTENGLFNEKDLMSRMEQYLNDLKE